jgi:hypothetical protein
VGNGGIAPSFLTPAIDGRELSASRPGLIIPGEGTAGTHCIGCRLGHRAGTDAVEKRSISHAGNRIP